jgi:pyridoxine 5-phosphate synthase
LHEYGTKAGLIQKSSNFANELGLGINAGHDLSLIISVFLKRTSDLLEVSIGHALITESLYLD